MRWDINKMSYLPCFIPINNTWSTPNLTFIPHYIKENSEYYIEIVDETWDVIICSKLQDFYWIFRFVIDVIWYECKIWSDPCLMGVKHGKQLILFIPDLKTSLWSTFLICHFVFFHFILIFEQKRTVKWCFEMRYQ